MIVTAVVTGYSQRTRTVYLVEAQDGDWTPRRFKLKRQPPTKCYFSKGKVHLDRKGQTFRLSKDWTWSNGRAVILLSNVHKDRDGRHYAVAYTTMEAYDQVVAEALSLSNRNRRDFARWA